MKLFVLGGAVLLMLRKAEWTSAFNTVNMCTTRTSKSAFPALRHDSVMLYAAADHEVVEEATDESQPKIATFLAKRYPSFYKLFNEEMTKAIKKGDVTIFAFNEEAFQKLGENKKLQLEDQINLEIREKIGSFHIIPDESISAVQLALEDWSRGIPKDGSRPNTRISGVQTIAGLVPVGRCKSGGFLGFGAKEDGDIVIGPQAKIVQSFNVEGNFVHEVDHLISPTLLWRYCDQLRIL